MQVTATVFAYMAYTGATPAQPFPDVWGIPFSNQGIFFIGMMLMAEVFFISGLILLGGLWWEKFRQVFVWRGAEIEKKNS